MKALVYHLSLPRVIITKLAGAHFPWLVYGPMGPLRLAELPRPTLRGPDWALVAPRLAGICGTDIGAITAQSSPAASPFTSFPAVPGHEVMGVVLESGSRVPLAPGTRVVLDPSIHCQMRGFTPCTACQKGSPYHCRNVTAGDLSAGLITGFCRDLPGGWSEVMQAHGSQLYPIPDDVSDERAVMVEPLSICLHAVLQKLPGPEGQVLVLGGGTIGLCTVAILRMLGLPNHITVTARYGPQAEMASALGADRVIPPRQLLEEVKRLGASSHRPIIGRPVIRGGYDVVYDTVGTRRSLDDALRVTREGGQLILLGGAGEIRHLDWTFIWMQELTVIGTAGYGMESWQGRTVHAFELVLEKLRKNPQLRVENVITHRFPLNAHRQAVQSVLSRRASGAIKVVFTPGDTADGALEPQGRHVPGTK